jgi:hypothetical protein
MMMMMMMMMPVRSHRIVLLVLVSWTISYAQGLSNQLKIAFVTGNKMKVRTEYMTVSGQHSISIYSLLTALEQLWFKPFTQLIDWIIWSRTQSMTD